MQIPKKVKIGAVWYKVLVTDKWIDGGDWDGECRYDKESGHIIYVRSTLTPEAQITTFIHEVLHVLNSTMDHCFLDSLAEQLGQVFIENKLLK